VNECACYWCVVCHVIAYAQVGRFLISDARSSNALVTRRSRADTTTLVAPDLHAALELAKVACGVHVVVCACIV
jgi:hypothetical protein